MFKSLINHFVVLTSIISLVTFLRSYSVLSRFEYSNDESHHTIIQIESSTSNSALLRQADEQIQAVANELENLDIRYYLYDHPNMTNIGGEGLGTRLRFWENHKLEVEYDDQVLTDLQSSPLRTTDPEQADIFIPLLNLGRIAVTTQDFSPVKYVLEHEYFRKSQGRNYVFLCTCFLLFRRDTYGYFNLKDYYPALYNITVVQTFDGTAIYNEFHHSKNGTKPDWGPFNEIVGYVEPVTRKGVSISLPTPNDNLGLALASREKFDNSPNFIFYHTRTRGSVNNSTIFRHAPVISINNETFPKSSIGWGLGAEDWDREFKSSKFCPVIRGDSPHTHAFMRSIRVGCIPVIISNPVPIHSPILKSSIHMSDYAIILDEEVFINNPHKALLKLKDIPEEHIDIKLKHLAFAQRVLFSDHPQSLFIPAFIKETQMAEELRLV